MNTQHALIIDDNGYNAEVLTRLLSAQNIASTTIQDPAVLQDIVNELNDVTVIFLDLEMPHLNGYEVLEILQNEVEIAAPVVACTVHTAEINTARQAGFHSFLGKPLDPKRFPEQLKSILAGKPVWELP